MTKRMKRRGPGRSVSMTTTARQLVMSHSQALAKAGPLLDAAIDQVLDAEGRVTMATVVPAFVLGLEARGADLHVPEDVDPETTWMNGLGEIFAVAASIRLLARAEAGELVEEPGVGFRRRGVS